MDDGLAYKDNSPYSFEKSCYGDSEAAYFAHLIGRTDGRTQMAGKTSICRSQKKRHKEERKEALVRHEPVGNITEPAVMLPTELNRVKLFQMQWFYLFAPCSKR